ncbi:hypothetical protein [Synechococcus sp. KORDI-52]|uniref:hypothetical protein n=1 Tax=Synechococcus sp. KORDI-52 TaxID=585425 RepID=UPI0012EBA084|nr:hypothetical protein [Synechococcus sp. KORDI-52]
MAKEKHEVQKKISRAQKDLETCLIIAGSSGAGKSTIVKYSHALDIKLYGKEFHDVFKKTWTESPYQEFNRYSEATLNGSTFEGRLLGELHSDKAVPKNILLHIDLKLLTTILGYRAASANNKRKIKSLTKVPVPRKNRVDPKICDLMVSSFLEHKFFSRFKRIVINTVVTDYKTSYLQKKQRRYQGKKIKSSTRLKTYASEHRAMYKAWNENIYRLKPSKIIFTSVGKDGGLYSNNQCICTDWTTKIGHKKSRSSKLSKVFNTNRGKKALKKLYTATLLDLFKGIKRKL